MRLGLSQREAARRAGMSQIQLSRIERGQSSPTEDRINGLARAYGVPASALFGDTPPAPNSPGFRRGSGFRVADQTESPSVSEDKGDVLTAVLAEVRELAHRANLLAQRVEAIIAARNAK